MRFESSLLLSLFTQGVQTLPVPPCQSALDRTALNAARSCSFFPSPSGAAVGVLGLKYSCAEDDPGGKSEALSWVMFSAALPSAPIGGRSWVPSLLPAVAGPYWVCSGCISWL